MAEKPYQPGSGMVTPDKSCAQATQTVPGTNKITTGQTTTSPVKKLIREDSARAKGKQAALKLIAKNKTAGQRRR